MFQRFILLFVISLNSFAGEILNCGENLSPSPDHSNPFLEVCQMSNGGEGAFNALQFELADGSILNYEILAVTQVDLTEFTLTIRAQDEAQEFSITYVINQGFSALLGNLPPGGYFFVGLY